ncbi:hypothetical protein, conserved [Trypanosoma brucei gambiense DAL972]|uniref:COPI associated protein n=2 Tax=Trypanosoma brucei TaxID=5691 RepID=C9ZY95_TRYB9|nr:hypothetical protein, conserved [Trypanosoma brucei gambiense DAL972]RHW70500.1 COPI associated protein [Trypanosoma brucei equiperdum]CBH14394.1 hypothetical protein, conserved [Trypanosoma brucei gambiense DAL972]|eukprot:XP_011776660.1 hypothetical protein, conserved [Trypanosoma brucei gambiense DAL972]
MKGGETAAGVAEAGSKQSKEGVVDSKGDAWSLVFLILSIIAMALVISSSLVTLVVRNNTVADTFLELYMLVFAFLGLSAELRRFEGIRRGVYLWLRYFYFLTTYSGRGLFYIFLGAIAVGGTPLRYTSCVITTVLGFLMFVVNCFVNLPVYKDQ